MYDLALHPSSDPPPQVRLQANHEASPALPGLQGWTVLVVDANRTQRSQAVTLLQHLGAAEVLEAADGFQALAILDSGEPVGLMFFDLDLPRMDGMELVARLAARPASPHLFILSSLEVGIMESVRHMALTYRLSLLGVLSKPLTLDKVTQVLGASPIPSEADGMGHAPTQVLPTSAEILRALDRDEFECYFQPQLTMRDASLKGVEALVRWRHPDRGLLVPDAFLPRVVEDPDLMSMLTFQLLERLARHWRDWNARGLDLDLSINLSAVSIGTAGFAERILEVVARHRLPPKRLVLEITETASVANLGGTLANLARLRMHGFRLSIDDFGTGYATYVQLERLPFTELKIDLSIIRGITRSRKQSILAKNLIQLGKDLELTTVAEGIESKECWDLLKRLGCTCGQGYYLAAPMPGADLCSWMAMDRSHL